MSSPQPPPTEAQRLLLLIEANLHYLVRQPMSLDDARDLKQRVSIPMGVLAKRFNLRSEFAAKRLARELGIDMKAEQA